MGTAAPTERLTIASADWPAELEATSVKEVVLKTALGMPEITQVPELTDAHAGRGVVPDFMPQAVTVAPLLESVFGATDIATPKVPTVPVEPV